MAAQERRRGALRQHARTPARRLQPALRLNMTLDLPTFAASQSSFLSSLSATSGSSSLAVVMLGSGRRPFVRFPRDTVLIGVSSSSEGKYTVSEQNGPPHLSWGEEVRTSSGGPWAESMLAWSSSKAFNDCASKRLPRSSPTWNDRTRRCKTISKHLPVKASGTNRITAWPSHVRECCRSAYGALKRTYK